MINAFDKFRHCAFIFFFILCYGADLSANERVKHSVRFLLPVSQYSVWLDQNEADITTGGIEYTFFINEHVLFEASTSSIMTVCVDIQDWGQMTSVRGGYRLGPIKKNNQKLINVSPIVLTGYRLSAHTECDDGHERKTRAHSIMIGTAYDLHIGKGKRFFNFRPHVFFDQALRSRRVGRGATDTTFTSPIFKRSVTIGFSAGISF